MQLWHAVYGLRLRGRGQVGALVRKGIDGAVGWLGQPPCAAQIDHAHSAIQRFRHPLARLLMRRGEKQHIDAEVGEQLPGERLQFQLAVPLLSAKLRMNFGKRNAAARDVLGVHAPGEDRRLPFRRG